MPRETFTVWVALGFLVCLVMIPLSYLVLKAVLWVFAFGALAFFLIGVLSPRVTEEDSLRYWNLESRSDQGEPPGRAENDGSASVFSRYYW